MTEQESAEAYIVAHPEVVRKLFISPREAIDITGYSAGALRKLQERGTCLNRVKIDSQTLYIKKEIIELLDKPNTPNGLIEQRKKEEKILKQKGAMNKLSAT